jgi:HEXXH motif-containing protein
MLSFMQREMLARNVAKLAAALDEPDQDDPPRLRHFRCLHRLQRYPFSYQEQPPVPLIEFAIDLEPLATTVAHVLKEERIRPEHVLAPAEAERCQGLVDAGLALLERERPAGFKAACLLVGCLAFARHPSSKGGSCSDVLGLVWVNPPENWDALDYAEMILHETVHQAFFLDEMVNRVYQIGFREREEHLITSAVLRRKRPYDLALHSAVVAVELRDFCDELGEPERAQRLDEGLRPCVAELLEDMSVLTGHGRKLVLELAELTAGRVPV